MKTSGGLARVASSRFAVAVVVAGLVGGVGVGIARAAGVPNTELAPTLVYSGTLIRDGLPVTTPVTVEVGLWDDQVRGPPDRLLCSTGENVPVVPDAHGNFTVALPDGQPAGEGQDGKSCITELNSFAGRPTVYVQLEVGVGGGNAELVNFELNGQAVSRLPVSSVPFALDAERAAAASGPLRAELDDLRARLAALEGG